MIIHRISENESLADVAKKYDISVERIIENNTLAKENHRPGRELLILRPTRTYKTKSEDTVAAIACRFGVKSHVLMTNNPSLISGKLTEGRELAVKYPTPAFGTAATNGYVFAGGRLTDLKRAMPFITYLTLGAYKLADGRLMRLFDPKEYVRLGKENSKVTLMRVYDASDGKIYCEKEKRAALAADLIASARSGGFCGITLCSHGGAKNHTAEFSEFLMELRKNMIGCDLILFTETDETLPAEVAELADGSVFTYGKTSMENPPSFTDGELLALSRFADEVESSKAMIFLPSDAYTEGTYIPYKDALALGTRGSLTEFNGDTLLCRFSHRGKNVVFESLVNTKAKLDLASELGFMGIAFDVRCVPVEHLMMFSSLFSPVHYQMPFSFPM